MAWQVEDFHRTLYIVKVPKSEGKTQYRIYPMMSVMNKNTGATYMEFISTKGLTNGFGGLYDFDAVAFIDPPSTARASTASLLQLHANKVQALPGD